MDLADIPKTIRFDFFLAILGALLFYFVYTNNAITQNNDLKAFLMIISMILLLFGIIEMKNNYDKDSELNNLKYKLAKRNLEKKLGIKKEDDED